MYEIYNHASESLRLNNDHFDSLHFHRYSFTFSPEEMYKTVQKGNIFFASLAED